MSEQGQDPNDKYPTGSKDHEPGSEAQEWATSQNPVRDDALPAKNLSGAGG